MAKVRKRIVAKKALQSFVMYSVAVGVALSQIEIPDGDLSDKALITLGVSTLAAVLRAVNNVRKTRQAPSRPAPYVDYRNLTVLLIMAGLVSGCVTTTAPDGSTVVSVDSRTLETAWSIYEATLERKQTLQAERDAAQAADRARIERELRALEPELQKAWLAAMGLAD